jgi:hypothetical protein
MTFLPQRHRSPAPQVWNRAEPRHDLAHADAMHWRPVPVRRRSFLPVLLTAAIAAVIGFVVRSAIEQPRTPLARTVVIRQAAPPAGADPQRASGPCTEADGTVRGGPNVSGFGPPRDVFGFLPRCDQGGR